MQLNGGTTIMASSEPPEPPPRNPDRINASLNHKFNDSKITKSLDNTDKPVNNNIKPLRPILSLDNNTGQTLKTSDVPGGSSSSSSSITSPMNNFLINKPTDINDQNNTINPITTSAGSSIGHSPSNNSGSSSITSISNQINSTINMVTTGPVAVTTDTKNSKQNKYNNGQIDVVNGISLKDDYNNIKNDNTGANAILSGNNQCGTSNTNGQINSTQEHQQQQVLIKNLMQKGSEIFLDDNTQENSDGNRNDNLKFDTDKDQDKTVKFKMENEKLLGEIARLRKLLEISPDGAVGGAVELSDSNSFEAQSTDGNSSKIERLESDLKIARIQIQNLKLERKKLKSDKSELLLHVKQLCGSLQDKEQELRDFIRNFEQRIRETETSNAKVSSERERERWSLLKHARDEAERSLSLAQQLNARDIQLQRTQEQLQDARRQLSGCLSDQESLLSFAPLTPPSSGLLSHLNATQGTLSSAIGFGGDRGSCSADSGVRGSSDRESAAGDINFSDSTCENGPCITVDADNISIVSSQHTYQFGTPKDRSPTLSPLNSAAYSRSVEQLGSPCDSEGPTALTRKFPAKTSATGTLTGRSGRGGTWGSISRVFARSRNKNKAIAQEIEANEFSNWSPINEESYSEKLRLLREASQIPIERWRASQVLAWLEVALGMPQYSTRCSENVKSGKVLLELNDSELEAGLGLAHPMHRKKLRLAIEEQRRPDLVRYSQISQLGHTWVASEWLPDIGLPQYAEPFLHSLVDARMLDTLSKKELEKFLGVTRKFHQASIVHGIHVLRIVKYDRQNLAIRRSQCDNVDADPIVWTNQRFIRWARSIDLAEYADNLKDSGVHGGLVVLEPSFSGETMATALGIPPSKNIIRRHLSTEFDALILPARATLGQGIRSGCGVVPITGPGGLQHHFVTNDRKSSGSLRISSAWKGSQTSLSKAFRFNTKSKSTSSSQSGVIEKSMGNSTSPTPSYSSSESSNLCAIVGGMSYPNIDKNFKYCQFPPPITAPPPPPPPSHRVSAPPGNNINEYSPTSIYDHEHRRVKSISDIEVVTASV